MLVGTDVAAVSSSPTGCTFEHKLYETSIGNTQFGIYDTAGLNEGEQGRVPHWKAVQELYTLIRSLDGVSLLVYCMRGRIKENAATNWLLFHKVLCAKKVPIIAVETGLEHEEDLNGRAGVLKKALTKYAMHPTGVACIVSIRGKKNEYQELYDSSKSSLLKLIKDSYKKEPWSTETDDWIGHIYKTTYTTKLCLFPVVRVEFTQEVGNVVDKFIQETKMKKDESEKLKSTLLDAERKLTRFHTR